MHMQVQLGGVLKLRYPAGNRSRLSYALVESLSYIGYSGSRGAWCSYYSRPSSDKVCSIVRHEVSHIVSVKVPLLRHRNVPLTERGPVTIFLGLILRYC